MTFDRIHGELDAQQTKTRIPNTIAGFRVGNQVRVRHGVKDNDYLSGKLDFPFAAEHSPEYGQPQGAKVIGLGDPNEPMIDEMYGILCDQRPNLIDGKLHDAIPHSGRHS